MEFKIFKKFNYINASKKFCNHFHYICLCYRHYYYKISQRQHVFRVYVIHRNCDSLHNFFFFIMDYGEWLFTLKNVRKNDWKRLFGTREYILHKKFDKTLQELDWPFMLFWNLKSLYFTCFHLLPFIVPLYVIYCYSVPFAVTPCHSLSLVVSRCHMLHDSASFVVNPCSNRYHSLYH